METRTSRVRLSHVAGVSGNVQPELPGFDLAPGGVDQAHEQARVGPQPGDPDHPAAHRERAVPRLRRFARFEKGIRPRMMGDVAHQHRRDVHEPCVNLLGQFRTANRAQPGDRKTPERGAGKPLGDHSE